MVLPRYPFSQLAQRGTRFLHQYQLDVPKNDLKAVNETINKNINISVHSQGNQEVAFSVGVSKDLTLQHAEKVVYDTVFTNIGAGYNAQTGTFNCPVSGIYVFQVSSYVQHSIQLYIEFSFFL